MRWSSSNCHCHFDFPIVRTSFNISISMYKWLPPAEQTVNWWYTLSFALLNCHLLAQYSFIKAFLSECVWNTYELTTMLKSMTWFSLTKYSLYKWNTCHQEGNLCHQMKTARMNYFLGWLTPTLTYSNFLNWTGVSYGTFHKPENFFPIKIHNKHGTSEVLACRFPNFP